MNTIRTIRRTALLLCTAATLAHPQGTAEPLLFQGTDDRQTANVRALGMGGTVTAAGTGASALFSNPAALAGIGGAEIRFAGTYASFSRQQAQQWVPNRIYTGLSLMMEDMWGNIKAPTVNDTLPVTDPWEQPQRPFDAFGPDWSRSGSSSAPLAFSAAMPVPLGDVTLVVGAGVTMTSDLDHYFQNNNVTDPLLGQYRPSPRPEMVPGDTLRVRWYQYSRSRDGRIWGVTPAVAFTAGALTLGASATYYTGESDDREQRTDRGFLTFLYNRFKLQDTVHLSYTRQGTSTFTGFGGAVGIRYEQPVVTLAASAELPYTLTREYSGQFTLRQTTLVQRAAYTPGLTADSVNVTAMNVEEGKTEKISFPFSYALGVVLRPFNDWSFAFDYEVRNLSGVTRELASTAGVTEWVSRGSFRLGAEYRWTPQFALRAGYREVPQTFSPEGSAIIGEPAVLSVTSLGAGWELFGASLDVAYLYGSLRYSDMWQSNVNKNSTYTHRITAELGYRF
ncbi:MAG: hypothetical protein F9K22_07420 [Bacteroidetes bacterium]|nr:MAG: hypothetical protein F9K22_07420 [Bacteroidota bacterium]